MRTLWRATCGVGLGLALIGCNTRIPTVTPELVAQAQQRDPTVNTSDMEHARSLYVNRCGSCHALNDPQNYNVPEWRQWMQRMAPKARLDAEQQQAVLGYILAARELPH